MGFVDKRRRKRDRLLPFLLIIGVLLALVAGVLPCSQAYASTAYLYPNASGDTTTLPGQYPASGSHWDKVDDPFNNPDDDSTYVYSSGVGTNADLYNLTDFSVGGQAQINWVSVHLRGKVMNPAQADFVRIYLRVDGTTYYGSQLPYQSSYQNIFSQYSTNPKTGLSWTDSDLDNLQAGIYIVGWGGSRITQVYVEVDYVILPLVTTDAAANVEETSATLNGEITGLQGGGNCTVRGFQYDTDTGEPYSYDAHEDGSFGVGAYSLNISSLTEGELYYFRAYCTSPLGTGYGSELTFLTKPDPPTGFAATATGETQIDLSWANGAGSQKVYIRGKLGSAPENRTDGAYSWDGTGVTTSHTGLSNGQHWYYIIWSYATEGELTQTSDTPDASDDAITFTPPTLITGVCQGYGKTWGTVIAILVDDGTYTCTQVGFDYGLTTSYGSSWTESGIFVDGTVFLGTLTGLNPACVYHYRAKVYNGAWGYGTDQVFSTSGSPTKYEYLSTGGDGQGSDIYGANWAYQQFTVGDTSHTVSNIKLYLKSTGSPGTVTVSLRYADGDHFPTGLDLCSATLNGSDFSTSFTWYQFDVTDTSLEADQEYAIVVRAIAGDDSNDIQWKWDAGGGLDSALAGHSTDGSLSWVSDHPSDFLFEVWGLPCIRIESAAVFENYLEEGDLLFVAEYVNVYPPYYPNSICPSYFSVQLVKIVDATPVVIAQTACSAWGNKPGSIYLSADEASPITRGSQLYMRLYGNFSGNPVATYQLATSDWMGSDLLQLDRWVLTTAHSMASYYDRDMTAFLIGREALNQEGSIIFTTGINALDKVRPNLFQFVVYTPEYQPATGTTPWEDISWETEVGPGIAGFLNIFGGWFGMDGKDFAAFGLIGLYLLMACFAVYLGETKGGFNLGGDVAVGAGLAIPLVYVGAELGLLDIV